LKKFKPEPPALRQPRTCRLNFPLLPVPAGAKFLFLPALLFALNFLFSCATAPKISGSPDGYLPLEPGALLYTVIDAEKAGPILEYIPIREISGAQLKQVLDMTHSAAVAVYDGGPVKFQAAARGRYPAFRAGLSFAFSRDWKKKKSAAGPSYWRSETDNLSIALNSEQAFVSDGDPYAAKPGTRIPEDFAGFCVNSAIAFWLPQPSRPVNAFLDILEIPLQIPADELFAGLYETETKGGDPGFYEVLIRIKTPSISQARALVTLINLARVFIGGLTETEGLQSLARLFFANVPEQDGIYLNIRTPAMEKEELALLFNVFSVYFMQN
jgi:hypothetical protein